MTDDTNLPAHVAAESPKAIANAGMSPGGALGALVPQSLDDAFRLAKALASAGDMVPKHFQGKPEATMAAIVRGMEIGLAPMQSLSSIAVINGRASIWGDAIPALMQRSGHHIDVVVDGDGDKMVATATLVRGDTGQTIVRTFSVDDAKKALLWNKQGPWQQYPKRMLSHRARGLAARDGAADCLMGLQIAEEMRDAPPIRDVTPKTGGFAKMAVQARQSGKPEPERPTDDAIDGDVIPEFDEDAVDPMADSYDEGFYASKEKRSENDNPYEPGTEEWTNWIGGFRFHEANKSKAEDEV